MSAGKKREWKRDRTLGSHCRSIKIALVGLARPWRLSVKLTVRGGVEAKAAAIKRRSPWFRLPRKRSRAHPRNQKHDQRQQMGTKYYQKIDGRVFYDRSEYAGLTAWQRNPSPDADENDHTKHHRI